MAAQEIRSVPIRGYIVVINAIDGFATVIGDRNSSGILADFDVVYFVVAESEVFIFGDSSGKVLVAGDGYWAPVAAYVDIFQEEIVSCERDFVVFSDTQVAAHVRIGDDDGLGGDEFERRV